MGLNVSLIFCGPKSYLAMAEGGKGKDTALVAAQSTVLLTYEYACGYILVCWSPTSIRLTTGDLAYRVQRNPGKIVISYTPCIKVAVRLTFLYKLLTTGCYI